MAGSLALGPTRDGALEGDAAVTFPFMGPRLQGRLEPSGRLSLALWGAGDLATLYLGAVRGPCRIGPNRLTARGLDLHVARSAPAMLIRGARLRSLRPALRRAAWDGPAEPPPTVATDGSRRRVDLGWGALAVEQRGEDLMIAAGADGAELAAALRLTAPEIIAEASDHAARCDVMTAADPLLRSMVQQGAHAALSSIRRDAAGGFCGLAAGLAYSTPARTYFRDGYWTAQLLLRLAPDCVREQIDLIAPGIQPDGEAPSGVILEGDGAAAWAARPGRRARTHHRPRDWWSDHFDSPLFFILLIGDLIAATGDEMAIHRHWPLVRAILDRYANLCGDAGLPLKPRNDRDWADNVYRAGAVAYDLGLWVGALKVVARWGVALDPEVAEDCARRAGAAAPAITAALWTGEGFADYAPLDAPPEPHLALDSLTLLRYGAATEDQAATVLASVRRRLETRRNPAQRWGDWGMMCAYPPFARRRDTRAKSAFAFRYHNGADWPWLDGLYAQERLRRGLSGWRYPLLRWWEVSLAEGWAAPVEYYSPPFARGGLLQGWSGLPACVALDHAETVLAGDPEP